ncbi:MAG TPA: glycogen/starch synthase [Steroidobacteraceae bacterium]|nr:glycogen/starch synthase [Steroidobacteraceae bacterium]
MPIRICYLSAEMAPFAKVGGLADVSGALVKYLHAAGHDMRLFMPFHGSIQREGLEAYPVAFLQDVPLLIGKQSFRFSVQTARLPGTEAFVYLVDCPALFGGSSVYTADPLEYRRYLLLTHAAFLSCQRMGFAPQILHCNDWHTAIAPLWLRSIYRWDKLFDATHSVLSIHNLAYQGVIGPASAAEVLSGAGPELLHQDDLRAGRINLLRHGLLYADLLLTVSPSYAREIQTAEYGAGLDDTLRSRKASLLGILNGVDYQEWDPRNDRFLPRPYGANQLGVKSGLKDELLARLRLQGGERRALIGMITRLATQKGVDLLLKALPPLLATRDFSLAVLGSGEPLYEKFFTALARQFPTRVAFHRGYSEELAHWIEAGSDMFLMPSRYEPCGLNQMYSLRYGTVPIVRRTGGLGDSVQHFDAVTGAGTGIVFNDYNVQAVSWAIDTALDLYQRKGVWRRLVQNGMAQDFSWKRQVQRYIEAYEQLAG